jgi:hypothetical protein
MICPSIGQAEAERSWQRVREVAIQRGRIRAEIEAQAERQQEAQINAKAQSRTIMIILSDEMNPPERIPETE